MLVVEGLSVSYGPVQALQDVSLTVPPGQVTAVIGANGAGKSTLLRTLAGLVRPEAGRVTFNGDDITGWAPEDVVRSGIAMVPEGRSTIPELSVEENLRLGGLWRTQAQRNASEAKVFALFPILQERRHLRADTLSGGERQQLAIGRALMCGPQVLLLDEPSLGLAPRVTAQIMALLARLRDETGLTVLLVEQNVRSALSVADTAVVLALGRVAVATDAATLAADEDLRHTYLGF